MTTDGAPSSTANGATDVSIVVTPVVNLMDGTKAPFLGDQRRDVRRLARGPSKGAVAVPAWHEPRLRVRDEPPGEHARLGWPSYMVDRSAAKNRAMQWLVFSYGATGGSITRPRSRCWDRVDEPVPFTGNGDGTLFSLARARRSEGRPTCRSRACASSRSARACRTSSG